MKRAGRRKKKTSDPVADVSKAGRSPRPALVQTSYLTKWLVLATIVLLLVGLVLYMANSVDYSGPKFENSERGQEKKKQMQEKENKEQLKTLEDEKDPKIEEDSSTCEELTKESNKILKSSHLRESDIELALDMLATCALKDESNPEAKWNIAMALVQVNRPDEALQFIDETLTLAPANTQYLQESGMILAKMELHSEAVKCWETYLELVLKVTNWGHTLESISRQREDEWLFLHEAGDNIISLLQSLLNSYLRIPSFIKSSYLYKIIIGLRGMENSHQLTNQYAFYAYSIGDLANGIGYLQYHTETNYVNIGYGSLENAREIVKTHSLRLFTGGIDANIVSIVRNLLMTGSLVWDELVYHCNLNNKTIIDYSISVSLSDIKSIYIQCLLSQDIINELLQRDASIHAENIFGWTPLLQTISLDDPTILHHILSARADANARTAMGHTALHIAAMKGSTQVVLPLIQAGLRPNIQDAFNRTAMDIACGNRWFTAEFAKALNVKIPSGCLSRPLYVPRLKEGFKSGGWLPSSIKLPHKLVEEKCDFDVIGYTSTPEELIINYLSLQKPVLVRNATNSKVMKKLFNSWQRVKMEKQYGSLKFKEVLVPYAESFGYNESSVTLKKFFNKLTELNDRQRDHVKSVLNVPPSTYIFQTLPDDSPLLEHFQLPTALNTSITEIAMGKIQFYVGGTLSGAPFHFHRSAWNVLIYGKKRWFVSPPKYAFYSRQHVWDWWREKHGEHKDETATSSNAIWECVQYPGDMIVLPDMWGHAVINLQESVGLASEFVYGSSEFSL
jgi:tetratricopeptide (TPR) repeat protein